MSMFSRFTERAKKVVILAREEAGLERPHLFGDFRPQAFAFGAALGQHRGRVGVTRHAQRPQVVEAARTASFHSSYVNGRLGSSRAYVRIVPTAVVADILSVPPTAATRYPLLRYRYQSARE